MKNKFSNRKLKAVIKEELLTNDFSQAVQLVQNYPPEQSVNSLISFFCSTDRVLKWRSISALGAVVLRISKVSPEKARIIMRRLMWTLNDESGGVGWGAPEAMGEIMARSKELSDEYSKILFSYLDHHGNFLDYQPLQQGVLWGIKRLSETRPEQVVKALDLTRPYLRSEHPVSRALAVMIAENTLDYQSAKNIESLLNDYTEVEIYCSGDFKSVSINRLASGTLTLFQKRDA